MTRRRGGVKTGESNLASNQFPKHSPQSRTPRKINKVEKRKGKKEFLLFNCNPKKIHMHLSIQTHIYTHKYTSKSFPGDSDGKEYACNVEDMGSIPELRRSPEERNSYPLQ